MHAVAYGRLVRDPARGRNPADKQLPPSSCCCSCWLSWPTANGVQLALWGCTVWQVVVYSEVLGGLDIAWGSSTSDSLTAAHRQKHSRRKEQTQVE